MWKPIERDTRAAATCRSAVHQRPSQADFIKDFKAAGHAGWGGRDRTSEWRNQNPLDYSMILTRIWKKAQNCVPAISIAWQLFPNERGASETIEYLSATAPFGSDPSATGNVSA
jgi:hypothetical protein